MKLPTPWQLAESAGPLDAEDYASGGRAAYEAVEKVLREDASDRNMRYLEAGAYLRIADAIRRALDGKE